MKVKCAIFKILTQRSSGNVPLSQSNESSDFTGFLVYSLKTSDKVVRYGENNQVEFSEYRAILYETHPAGAANISGRLFMKGSEAKMIEYMEGAGKRYVIPVYQRKYDWKEDNCRQLYEDLKKIVRDSRDSHFFGSIVSSVIGNGASTEYHIIDGQQRLTTVTLLLLAIRNLIRQKKISAQEDRLDDQINDRFLVSPWAKEDDKIKLRPVKSDREALR